MILSAYGYAHWHVSPSPDLGPYDVVGYEHGIFWLRDRCGDYTTHDQKDGRINVNATLADMARVAQLAAESLRQP